MFQPDEDLLRTHPPLAEVQDQLPPRHIPAFANLLANSSNETSLSSSATAATTVSYASSARSFGPTSSITFSSTTPTVYQDDEVASSYDEVTTVTQYDTEEDSSSLNAFSHTFQHASAPSVGLYESDVSMGEEDAADIQRMKTNQATKSDLQGEKDILLIKCDTNFF